MNQQEKILEARFRATCGHCRHMETATKGDRPMNQQEKILQCLLLDRPTWLSIPEISYHTREPECSVSAQLRHLRKKGWTVSKRVRHRDTKGHKIYEYTIEDPTVGGTAFVGLP